MTMRITIPGKVWSIAIEESGVPAQENWPVPTFLFRGKGSTVTYEADPWEVGLILTHLEDIADCFKDPENRADRYAIQAAVRSLYTQIATQVAPSPDSGVQSEP